MRCPSGRATFHRQPARDEGPGRDTSFSQRCLMSWFAVVWDGVAELHLRQRQHVPVGILEPRDASAARRCPDAAIVLLHAFEALELDPAFAELLDDRRQIGNLPAEDRERLRAQVPDLLDAERRAVGIAYDGVVILGKDLETERLLLKSPRRRRAFRGHECNERALAKHGVT